MPLLTSPARLPVILVLALAGCAGDFGASTSRLTTSEHRIAGLQQDLTRRPNDGQVLRDLGQEYAVLSRWPQSQGAYGEALVLNPGDHEAVLGYARAQLAAGDYAGALAQADRALALRRDDRALITRAGALTGLNRLAEAQATLRDAMAQSPRDLDIRNNLALVTALSGDGSAYGLARAAAFAPDADLRHRRNLVLVAGILGMEANGRQDGAALGLGEGEIGQILTIGTRARSEGIRAFGVAPMARN